MTPYEKHARFNLMVLFITATVFGVLIPFLGVTYAGAALGLLGLWALGPMFFGHCDELDERIVAIQHRASSVALGLYWIVLIATGLMVWLLVRHDQTAPFEWLPFAMLSGLALFVLVHAAVTLATHALENRYAGG